LCEELDTEVERFRTRKLDSAYPYVWLDATFLKVRQDHRVVNMAVVIAVGLNAATGQREVLGVDIGPSEDGAFWLRFLRGVVSRGLTGVQLVISDSHQGLKGAIAAVLQGASWQRCRTHFMRNALCLVPKGTQQMVAATIRTVFVQPDAATAREQWRRVADQLRARFPRVAALLDEAEDEVLAYLAFPQLCRYRHKIGYAAPPVMPNGRPVHRESRRSSRHNQRLSRKTSTASEGWNRPGASLLGVVRASARSFRERSAWR
jgi:transposase-like protein